MAELEPKVAKWVEEVVGGQIKKADRILAGGRYGWFIDCTDASGEVHQLFMQQARAEAGDPLNSPFMSFDKEAEVYRALHPAGIKVPKAWGVNADIGGFLVDRLPGIAWMQPPRDPEEQLSVAKDFIRQIAKMHKLDPNQLDIPSFKPVKTVKEHQTDRLKIFRAQAEASGKPIEPMLRITLEFLENNIPDYDGPACFLQGDTGPGNLMYKDGEVTGIIDWELAHLGDPMDDVAWMCWRTVQHTFTNFADRMREYEELSGNKIDLKRVYYYRVNAFAVLCAGSSAQEGAFGLPSMSPEMIESGASRSANPESQRGADGSAFAMTTLHRRMRLVAIADAMGIELPSRDITEQMPPRPEYESYDDLLDKMKDVVPNINDPMAKNIAKGIVRKLKHLKELSRNGVLYDQRELDNLGRLLGKSPTTLGEGRDALYKAVLERKVSDEKYILYHWDRLIHDEHLMQYASGTLYNRGWPELF